MVIYTGAIIWILIMYWFDTRSIICVREVQVARQSYAFLSMLYLVFFIGLRNAGADTSAYIRSYNETQAGIKLAMQTIFNFRQGENLFEAYTIFMKTIFGNNYTPFLFGIAAISGFSVAKTLYNYSEGFYTSMLLFCLWGMWSWMYNGIRQFLAVSIVLLGTTFIENGKLFLYLLVVFIASCIHTSALVMLPVFFIVRAEPWSFRSVIPILIVAFAVFFTSPFLMALETVTESTNYGSILSNSYFVSDTGSNPIRTVIYAIPLLLAYSNRKIIKDKAPMYVKICVNMSLLCVCVSCIANVTSGIYIGRLNIYFAIYNLILIPWIFCNTRLHVDVMLTSLIMGLYGVYYFYMNYINSHPYYSSDILGLFLR